MPWSEYIKGSALPVPAELAQGTKTKPAATGQPTATSGPVPSESAAAAPSPRSGG